MNLNLFSWATINGSLTNIHTRTYVIHKCCNMCMDMCTLFPYNNSIFHKLQPWDPPEGNSSWRWGNVLCGTVSVCNVIRVHAALGNSPRLPLWHKGQTTLSFAFVPTVAFHQIWWRWHGPILTVALTLWGPPDPSWVTLSLLLWGGDLMWHTLRQRLSTRGL